MSMDYVLSILILSDKKEQIADSCNDIHEAKKTKEYLLYDSIYRELQTGKPMLLQEKNKSCI